MHGLLLSNFRKEIFIEICDKINLIECLLISTIQTNAS